MAKQSVWLIWIGSLAAMWLGEGTVRQLGSGVFWLTAIAHLIEFVVHRSLFRKAGGSMTHHFVQTMIYGLFHWTPIKREIEGS